MPQLAAKALAKMRVATSVFPGHRLHHQRLKPGSHVPLWNKLAQHSPELLHSRHLNTRIRLHSFLPSPFSLRGICLNSCLLHSRLLNKHSSALLSPFSFLLTRHFCFFYFQCVCVSIKIITFAMVKPKSVIRDQGDFVLLSGRLAVVLGEGVAGHVEPRRQTRCRQEDKSGWEAKLKLKSALCGLMTDLG